MLPGQHAGLIACHHKRAQVPLARHQAQKSGSLISQRHKRCDGDYYMHHAAYSDEHSRRARTGQELGQMRFWA